VMHRIRALLWKEFVDLRLNPSVFLPVGIVGVMSLAIPFMIAIVVPAITGERLSDSPDFEMAIEQQQRRQTPGLAPEGAVQVWLFEGFLLFMLIVPVVVATGISSHSVVGEKRARTLEPLLATPITTFELLAAKTLGAWLPAVGLALLCFGAYVGGIAAFGEPGVVSALLSTRSFSVVLLLGPLAALAALQATVCVSSRAKDERTAQQWGSLIVLPIAGSLIAPFLGVEMTLTIVLVGIVVLAGVNVVLMRVAVRVFDRESILTRWK
jgi:ABC-2 type transport system permease protein